MLTEKVLNDVAANQTLEKIGMMLGHWHRMEYLDEKKKEQYVAGL